MNDWLVLCRLHFTPLRTSLVEPLLATVAQNRIIVDSLLTYTVGLFTHFFHPSFTLHPALPSVSCIHLQTFGLQPLYPGLAWYVLPTG